MFQDIAIERWPDRVSYNSKPSLDNSVPAMTPIFYIVLINSSLQPELLCTLIIVKPVYFGYLASCWDPKKTVLIIEVSLFYRFIYTHYYIAMGPQLTVLIIEVSLFQSVHNSSLTATDYAKKL